MIKLKPKMAGGMTLALWTVGLAWFHFLNQPDTAPLFDSPWFAMSIAIPVGMLMLAWRLTISTFGGGPALTSGRGQVVASVIGGVLSGLSVMLVLEYTPMVQHINRGLSSLGGLWFFILLLLVVRFALVGILRNLSLGPPARTPEERAAWIAKRAEEAANPPHAWLTVDWSWGAAGEPQARRAPRDVAGLQPLGKGEGETTTQP